MSTLLVLGYPTEEKAKEAYQEVLSLGDDFIVNLQSVAVVARRDNDKFDVVTGSSSSSPSGAPQSARAWARSRASS